jgi:hypothetical protein
MSETTDYNLAKTEIASFIGTPEQRWDNRTAIDVESAIRKGIESVVHNGMHGWSWMRPTHRFQTADGQRRYTLPLDFEQFIDAILFDGEEYAYPPIEQLPSSRLAQMYSEYNNTGVPTQFGLEVPAHDGATQQHRQLVLHPTPDGTYTLIGPYQVGPIRSLTTARPWFPGGPENRELFIAACLAATESKFLDGPGTDKQDKFQSALAAAIGRDHRRQPRNLGQMGGRSGRRRDHYRWKLPTLYEGSQDA